MNSGAPATKPNRFWALLILVWVLPFAAYAPVLGARYGFRDDYSTLRESEDNLRTPYVLCASQGRPLYGVVLGAVFRVAHNVDGLAVLRAAVVALVGLVGVLLAWTLHRRIGLESDVAALLGLLAALLPSAQMKVAWAVCGPHVIGGLLALAAFLVADWARLNRVLAGAVAVLLILAGALFYQSEVLFYVVPVVAAGVFRSGVHGWRWGLRHGVILFGGLAVAFVVINIQFAMGTFPVSRRVVLEAHPVAKLIWYGLNNMREALGLFVIRDVAGGTEPWWSVGIALSAGAAIWGGVAVWRLGRSAWAHWAVAAGGGLIVAGSVSLIASERWPTYRTIWALATVVLVLVLRPLADCSRVWRRGLMAAIILPALGVAHWNVRHLLVEPQTAELALIEQAAERVVMFEKPRVLLILRRAADSRAPLRWLDEFGSNSSDSEWSPKEMLRVALRARGDAGIAAERGLRVKSSLSTPSDPAAYDVVIDLRVPAGR